MTSDYIILKGEIRKPKDKNQILRVISSDSEVSIEGRTFGNIDTFVPIGYDHFHAFVIEDRYTNLIDSSDIFYSVHLITHSDVFDNFKIEKKWIISNIDNFINDDSYITTEKFIIRENDINSKLILGTLDLEKISKQIAQSK